MSRAAVSVQMGSLIHQATAHVSLPGGFLSALLKPSIETVFGVHTRMVGGVPKGLYAGEGIERGWWGCTGMIFGADHFRHEEQDGRVHWGGSGLVHADRTAGVPFLRGAGVGHGPADGPKPAYVRDGHALHHCSDRELRCG
jgi:hypothetical protein